MSVAAQISSRISRGRLLKVMVCCGFDDIIDSFEFKSEGSIIGSWIVVVSIVAWDNAH